MKNIVNRVTIFALPMLILSSLGCSNDPESLSFQREPSFSVKINRVIADKLTMVVAVDDSASMVAKTEELEADMKDLFKDLIDAQWEIDLHLVTCAFYKGKASEMKSVKTSSFEGKTTQEKVDGIMKVATPKIDLDTLLNDADERCNQSLEKAWNLIKDKNDNKINMSLIISNEDDCSRDDMTQNLPHIMGGDASTSPCSAVTYNQISSTQPQGSGSLMNKPTADWTEAVADYSNNVWVPWFDQTLRSRVHTTDYYVNFFKQLETDGKAKDENFSHIYLPIVVDSQQCLAKTLMDQLELKEEEAREIAWQAHVVESIDVVPEFIFDGLQNTSNILANVGYRYLETFEKLSQDVEFSKEENDLSLCKDLSHIVKKISREIKLRGGGVLMNLKRPIDVESMMASEGDNFRIIRVIRPAEVEEPGFFEARNSVLRAYNIQWVRIDDAHWSIDLNYGSEFVEYITGSKEIKLLPNRLVSITGGDKISVYDFDPVGFRDN